MQFLILDSYIYIFKFLFYFLKKKGGRESKSEVGRESEGERTLARARARESVQKGTEREGGEGRGAIVYTNVTYTVCFPSYGVGAI